MMLKPLAILQEKKNRIILVQNEVAFATKNKFERA
jgi:hypothetical protein